MTAKRKVVTYRKQASRMASFGAVRYDREPLSNPYQTHDLCPVDLCPDDHGTEPCPQSTRDTRSRFFNETRALTSPSIASRSVRSPSRKRCLSLMYRLAADSCQIQNRKQRTKRGWQSGARGALPRLWEAATPESRGRRLRPKRRRTPLRP